MFELLGISLLLAALLTFNSFASVVSAGLWRFCSGNDASHFSDGAGQMLFALRVVRRYSPFWL